MSYWMKTIVRKPLMIKINKLRLSVIFCFVLFCLIISFISRMSCMFFFWGEALSNTEIIFANIFLSFQFLHWDEAYHIYPTPSLGQDMTQGQIFKRSLTGFPSPRLVASPRQKEPSLSYNLPIAGRRIIGFIPFPRVLVLCEMQSVLSRIWTRVAVSISYDDNHYTSGTSCIGWYAIKPKQTKPKKPPCNECS